MSKALIGVIANSYMIDESYPVQAAGRHNLEAIANLTDATPLVIPADPSLVRKEDLLEVFSGFIFPGGQPNVHPEEYGAVESPKYGKFDRARDNLTLPLIREAVARGLPILCICRGFQEMNVAFGGTLHPEIRELPGRENHRMPPDGTLEEKFALRHDVDLIDDSPLIALFGQQKLRTNSLHGQGILEKGERILVDGFASDGTPEVIRIEGAKGFAVGVQWHPEYNADHDTVSRPLFEAFGDAVARYARMAAE